VGQQYNGNTLSFHGSEGNMNAPQCKICITCLDTLCLCGLNINATTSDVCSVVSYLASVEVFVAV
jgi:hypothetical protein